MIKFAIGTAQFGQDYGICNDDGAVEGKKAAGIVTAALSSGVDMFDTARLYGDSESVLGQAFVDNVDVSQAKIVTKYYASVDNASSMFNEFAESQERFGGVNPYAILIHNADSLFSDKGQEVWNVLEQIKKEHNIQKIGVSVYAPEELKKLTALYDINIVQFPCNILDQRFFTKEIQALKIEHDIEFHARSLFLQGLLLSPIEELPEQFQAYGDVFKSLTNYASEKNISVLNLCLAYAEFMQDEGFIDRWVIGVDAADQLKDIVVAAQNASNDLNEDTVRGFMCDDPGVIDPRTWKR